MRSSSPRLHSRLEQAQPGDHLAKLFASDDRLVDTVAAFAREGLRRDQGVVLLLAERHLDEVATRLAEPGTERAELVVESADRLLERILSGGRPDGERFRTTVGELIDRARRGDPDRQVRVFGEAVQLLREESDLDAVVRLEELWRDLVESRRLILLCGYHVTGPRGERFPEELAEAHTEVIHEPSARERLIEAAGELFASGFDEATTAAIARRAGSSESQIVKHFGGKLGLLQAIFERWWDEALSTTHAIEESGLPARETLISILDSTLAALRTDPALARVVLFETRRLRGADRILSHGLLRFVELLDGVLTRAEREARLAEGFTAQTARDALLGACEGLLRSHLIAESTEYPAPYGLSEIRAAYVALVQALLPPAATDPDA